MIGVLEAIGGLLALGVTVYLISCFVLAVFNAYITDSIARGFNW